MAALPVAGPLCCRARWSLRVFPTYRRRGCFVFRASGASPPQAHKPGWLGLSAAASPCPGAAAAGAAASPAPPLLLLLPPARSYSSEPERGDQQPQKKVVVVGIPNPFVWFQTRLFFFFIRAYFDQEFSIHEFTQGAKQAFALVSKLISQCKYDLLEELVSKEVLQVLKEKVSSLSENHRSALAADEIMYTTARDVGIYYDDKGRKFVSILMGFWYLTSVDLPDETPDSTKVFQVAFTDKPGMETKRLLTANYEFKREFTQGVKPDWTITRIEHPKLLE